MYFWTPPVLNLEIFCVQKISWWYDKPPLMTLFWKIVEGNLAKIWSVRVGVQQVTRADHWISCFNPYIIQNWWYFLVSADANFVQTVFSSWIMFMLKFTKNMFFSICINRRKAFVSNFEKGILGRRSVNNSNHYWLGFR